MSIRHQHPKRIVIVISDNFGVSQVVTHAPVGNDRKHVTDVVILFPITHFWIKLMTNNLKSNEYWLKA